MSIIQTIQEKYAKVMAVIIAIALLIFVVMLAFENGGSLFSGSTTVGEVDGKKIPIESFNVKVNAYQRQGQGGEMAMAQAVDQAWNDTVDSLLLAKEMDKLGIRVTDKEITNLMFSANAPQEIQQIFTDPQKGVYDPAFAREQFNKIKKGNNADQKAYLNALVDYLEKKTRQDKYTALLANSINYPKWFLEKRNVDNSMMANLSYVAVPYTSISDSTIKISDDEIRAYVNKHPKEFEQKEEQRSVNYVSFSASPSAADTAASRNQLLQLKPTFDTINNYKSFVERNSALPLYEGFISRSAMQQPNKDSILAQPAGVVYGPYLDANQFVLSKIYAVRQIPDTVTVRHILVATVQQGQNGEQVPVREEADAKKIIDSVQALHRSGSSFDSLVVKFSDDPGSKNTGGKYENITTGRMVPEFNDFVFTNGVGTTGVVKTQFGYHYIEVLSAKGSSTGYKIAYLAKPIETSTETEAAAQNAASLFAGDSRDGKAFNDNWEKNLKNKGINKLTASDISPMAYNLQGVNGSSRKLVKDIFDADLGDVVGPERVGDAYIVATVTEVNKPGKVNVNRARPTVEPVLRNKKKAEQIKKNIGAISSLEAVAQKTGQQVLPADSVRFSGGGSALGYEMKVIGAAFNPANKGKVINEAIEGQTGVYVVRVNNTYNTPVAAASVEEQRRQLEAQSRQQLMSQMQYGGNPFTGTLRKSAKIEDNRAKFF